MAELLSVAGAVCAVIGGYVLVRWLFTHKRFTAKRPRRFGALGHSSPGTLAYPGRAHAPLPRASRRAPGGRRRPGNPNPSTRRSS